MLRRGLGRRIRPVAHLPESRSVLALGALLPFTRTALSTGIKAKPPVERWAVPLPIALAAAERCCEIGCTRLA